MAKVVVSWPALFVALTPIVVLITSDPDAVLNVGCDARVLDGLPMVSGIHHSGVNMSLDQILLAGWKKEK